MGKTKSIIFVFEGNIPPKKNNRRLFNRGGYVKNLPSKAYEKWHKIAMVQITQQKLDFDIDFPIEKCKSIEVDLFYGTLRRKDNSNTIESVHDLLVDAGVLKDDDWQTTGRTSQTPFYRKGLSGAEVRINLI